MNTRIRACYQSMAIAVSQVQHRHSLALATQFEKALTELNRSNFTKLQTAVADYKKHVKWDQLTEQEREKKWPRLYGQLDPTTSPGVRHLVRSLMSQQPPNSIQDLVATSPDLRTAMDIAARAQDIPMGDDGTRQDKPMGLTYSVPKLRIIGKPLPLEVAATAKAPLQEEVLLTVTLRRGVKHLDLQIRTARSSIEQQHARATAAAQQKDVMPVDLRRTLVQEVEPLGQHKQTMTHLDQNRVSVQKAADLLEGLITPEQLADLLWDLEANRVITGADIRRKTREERSLSDQDEQSRFAIWFDSQA